MVLLPLNVQVSLEPENGEEKDGFSRLRINSIILSRSIQP